MTVIENLNPRVQYNGPIAINDALSINFPYTNTEDVKCVANNKQLVYNQDYTVLEQTLTIKIAIPKGQTVTIYRSTPLDQQAEFPQNNKFNSEKMNEALDKICMQQQEQVEESRRSVRVPISVINFDGQLPIPIPGRSLKINEDGTSFVLTEYDSDKAYSTTEQFKKEAQQARDEAITQAGIATTQAGIATTQANNAATSAAQAESTLNSATDTIEQEEQKAINNIQAQQQTGINAIEQKGLDAVQTIERKQNNAVALLQNAADSNIEVMNNIKTETAQFLNSAEQEAEKSANSAQQANTAKQETQSILETATNTIDAEEASALNAIASNRSKALTDIQTNQQSAITAIGNSKNAAVNAVVTQQNTSVSMVSAQQTTSVKAVQNQEANSIASVQNQEAISINNVKASGQNYVNKCKDWATSDNVVEDGLRSAKYYAEHAQGLSDITYEQLRSSNAYENNGALLTDEEGYADILKMKHDNFDKEKFTIVGSPTITDDGVASGFDSANCVKLNNDPITLTNNSSFKINGNFTIVNDLTQDVLSGGNGWNILLYLSPTYKRLMFNIAGSNFFVNPAFEYSLNTVYQYEVKYESSKLSLTITDNFGNIWSANAIKDYEFSFSCIFTVGNTHISSNNFTGSTDLKQFKITVDGKEVFNGAKTGIDNVEGIEIPYTISKTGAKIVSAEHRNKVIELYEKTGQANYYTLDTEKAINCTVLGTPTVKDSIVSSFTADNYLTIPNYTSVFKDNSWSIETKQQYLTSDNTQFKGLSLSKDNPLSGFLGIYGSSVGFYYSVDGSYYNIKTTLSEIGVSNNSWVHLKVVFELDTKQCSVFAAINNDEFTLIRSEILVDQIDFVQEDITPIINCFNPVGMLYGATMPFDLNYLNIEINSKKIFSGMKLPNFTLPMGNIYGLIRQNSDTLATKVNEDEMVEIDFADAGSYIAGCAMPSGKYIDLTMGANGTEYTAPANGWFQFFGTINTGYMHFINHVNGLQSDYIRNQSSGAMTGCCKIETKKGDVVVINYNSTITTTNFRFIYAEGEVE